MGVDEKLKALDGLTLEMVIALGEAKIKTLEDFADLASDEIVGVDDGILREYKLEAKKANELILRARRYCWLDFRRRYGYCISSCGGCD